MNAVLLTRIFSVGLSAFKLFVRLTIFCKVSFCRIEVNSSKDMTSLEQRLLYKLGVLVYWCINFCTFLFVRLLMYLFLSLLIPSFPFLLSNFSLNLNYYAFVRLFVCIFINSFLPSFILSIHPLNIYYLSIRSFVRFLFLSLLTPFSLLAFLLSISIL